MALCVGVIGGGSFGTALANILAENGHDVLMWSRDVDVCVAINETHHNHRYLPDVTLHPGLKVSTSLPQVVLDRPLLISAVPAQVTRQVLGEVFPLLQPGVVVVSVSKGIELDSLCIMSDVMAMALPGVATAFLSGPTFARELARRLPSAATVASHDHAAAELVQGAFASPWFRIYTSEDVVGLEVAGAVKNVMAIAAGISDGLELGHNTRAALITRGLAEMARLGVTLGGKQETFMGLSGMGDLVLTCTGDASRNRTVGLQIGRGRKLDQILAEMTQVAEGVKTTAAVHGLARRVQVEMPIVDQVYQALYEGKDARKAVFDLMVRPSKREVVPPTR